MSTSQGRRRVVVTGVGIVSCLGHDLDAVEESLREQRSGIRQMAEWQELGLRSHLSGDFEIEERVERSAVPERRLDTMGRTAMYAVLAAEDAIASAGLSAAELGAVDCACLVSSGVGALHGVHDGAVQVYGGKARRVRPFAILQAMASSANAHVTQTFGIGGRSYSLASACATSTHSVGHGLELIRGGSATRALVGGSEDVEVITAGAFAALRGALSTGYNDRPAEASRPFDEERDGFVLSRGGAVLVLEELEAARERGAEVLGEILGFGANSDPHDIVQTEPSGARAAQCMEMALTDAALDPSAVDYVNAHATSTPVGDGAEISALRKVFGSALPALSSTKALNGHSLGAAGAQELIHCLAMQRGDFLAAATNLKNVAEEHRDVPFVREVKDGGPDVVLSNSFGFGGTNGTLLLGSPARI
ncbi:MAG: beta-ketoacyl-[acyl-carrier-protein] synthase family protein [Acidobacteriota bacterium]